MAVDMSDPIVVKIFSGEYIVQKKISDKKLKVWDCFNVIFDTKGKTELKYAQCKMCIKILSYTDGKLGKSKLFNHKCMKNREKLTNGSSLKQVAKISKSKAISISKRNKTSNLKPKGRKIIKSISKPKLHLTIKAKKKLQFAYVNTCVEYIRPIETLLGPEFINFAQRLVSFGASYGNQNIKEILPLKEISSLETDIANCARKDIYPEVREAICNSYCSATVNMWTDYYKKVSYISTTVHYIDKDWTMVNTVLFTSHFEEEQKCGKKIEKEIIKGFSELNLQDELVRNVTFITEEEPNIVEALQSYTRNNCSSHIINSILCQTFDEDFLEGNAPEIQKLILHSKSLVIYLKENGLESKLKQPIHFHENEARWNSKLPMLKSILNQYCIIEDMMKEKKLDYFKNISKDNLQDLVSFLEPFKDASDDLENKNSSTIHLVLLCRLELCEHLKVSDKDSINLKVLKERAKKILEDEYLVRPIHNISLFLCPYFRQLRMLTDTERRKVLKDIHEEINCDCLKNVVEPEKECPAPKRRKTSRFLKYKDIANHDDTPSNSVSCKEIQEYMNYQIDEQNDVHQIDEQNNVLQFWKSHESTFPELAKLVKKYLSIPASCVWSERNFSTGETTLAQRSTTLKEENVDDLLLLHSLPFSKRKKFSNNCQSSQPIGLSSPSTSVEIKRESDIATENIRVQLVNLYNSTIYKKPTGKSIIQ